LRFLSGSCSETEVSEQLSFTARIRSTADPPVLKTSHHVLFKSPGAPKRVGFFGIPGIMFKASSYLKSEGRLSVRLHFSHSAIFLTLPFSKRVFILTSPPQEQKNFWVALEVREFLLA
jgi:hypothetical protein